MFKNKIKVYYAALNNRYNNSIHLKEPDSVLKMLKDNHKKTDDCNNSEHSWKICPAIKDYYHNVFCVRSTNKYRFTIDKDNIIWTNDMTPEEYHTLLRSHSLDQRMYGFSLEHLFIADTDSLMMEQLHPVMASGDFANKVSLVQGHLDCAKYYRPLETAFKLNDSVNKLDINFDDPLYYVKFRTDLDIEFVRFAVDDELQKFIIDYSGLATRVKGRVSVLEAHYNIFKNSKVKSHILKMVKERAYK